ncbi:peptidoglycan-binding protein [Allokutzneria oryzae]|uniref:Peptidoglycan-binding protein n=1 Tax=Allokutzneria oryzae TaxID=1378989 RepID=A0ABV5ZN77_9PSEU
MTAEHRGRRIVVVALVAVAGLGGTAFFVYGGPEPPPPPAAAPVRTTTVRLADLANTQSFSGTLGFGAAQSVKGTGPGVVTKLPTVGDVAARGKPLYWVDGRPVPVFFGDTPLFRKIDTVGVKGDDVAMVADNLAALGFKVGAQRSTVTPALLDALKKWQVKAGLDVTGTLEAGQAAVVAGPVRVNSVAAQLGDPAAGPLLTVTSTAKIVTMPVDAGEIGVITTGAPVTVVLPTAKEVPARVTAVSSTVDGGDTKAIGGPPPKINVTVTPDDAAGVAQLDLASVRVRVTTEERKAVLTVPVGALVALREGGYAVQQPDNQLKAVETGMFAKGLVEISGPGITAGLPVVTTS